MASSSTSSSSSSNDLTKHDVFLSFSGETRRGFTSYLYRELKRKGIGAYMDEGGLKMGDELSPALLKAIEESKISLVIFSKSYAASSWCLRELFKIMELKRAGKQAVFPIFYHVNPSDVRKRTGCFENSFANHLEKFGREYLQGLEEAFSEASRIKGWHIKEDTSDRSEPEYIDNITENVIDNLNHNSSSCSNGLVGVDGPLETIKYLLCIGGEGVRIIGLWGIGGIGKKTLAKAIFDEFRVQFESCCFLENVMEESEKCGGITSLRDKLVSRILEENICLGTSRVGSTVIKNRLCRKRVLVVLDDVSDLKQLECLGISRDEFGSGSRIIVTSRDKQVLRNYVDIIYCVQELNDNDSLHLFSLCAFKQNYPVNGFEDLTRRALQYAKGIPIALKVLGSTLFRRNREYWISFLNKLKEHPNLDILNLLKISFDRLDDIEKNIFLDIACFFKGSCRVHVMKLLDSCYGDFAHCGISNLIDKGLITGHSILGIHDLVQEMGWNVVRQESKEPGERSRSWAPTDVCRLLKHVTGTRSVEGIVLDMSQIDQLQIHPDAFARMHNLRFIKFYYPQLYRKEQKRSLLLRHGLNSLHGELRYFHWEDSPLRSLPSNFSPENLIEFRVPGSDIEKLWDGDQNLENLKVIDLQECKNLTKIPNLTRCGNLEVLLVSGCKSLVELPCMTHLKLLKNELDFSRCDHLKKFPEVPKHLKRLSLSWTAIEEVPSSIESLKELEFLDLKGTRIHNLPSSILKLDSLKVINSSCCLNIVSFPYVPGNMTTLCLDNIATREVSSSIGRLRSLDLNGCSSLTTTPDISDLLMELRNADLCMVDVGKQSVMEFVAREGLQGVQAYLQAARTTCEADMRKVKADIRKLEAESTKLSKLRGGNDNAANVNIELDELQAYLQAETRMLEAETRKLIMLIERNGKAAKQNTEFCKQLLSLCELLMFCYVWNSESSVSYDISPNIWKPYKEESDPLLS